MDDLFGLAARQARALARTSDPPTSKDAAVMMVESGELNVQERWIYSNLDFDHILAWAKLLDVEINYPPVDDMWPDWENELAVEVGDAMRKIGD